MCRSAATRSLAQLHVPVGVQHLHHHHADGERVGPTPRLRAVVQQPEFGRQRVLVLIDKEVDSARVLVQPRPVGRWQVRIDAPRRQPELHHPLRLVVLEQRGPHHFGQFPIRIAAPLPPARCGRNSENPSALREIAWPLWSERQDFPTRDPSTPSQVRYQAAPRSRREERPYRQGAPGVATGL